MCSISYDLGAFRYLSQLRIGKQNARSPRAAGARARQNKLVVRPRPDSRQQENTVWLRVDRFVGVGASPALTFLRLSQAKTGDIEKKILGHSTILYLFLPPNPSSWCARCRVPALHKGSQRKRTLQVYVDDVLAATWTSSGDTPGFESIDLSGSSGFVVVVTAVLADMEWIGINEVGSEFHPFMLAFRRATTTVVLSLSLLLLLPTSARELLSLSRGTPCHSHQVTSCQPAPNTCTAHKPDKHGLIQSNANLTRRSRSTPAQTEIMVLWNDGILQDRTTPTPGSGTAPTPAPAPAAGVATPAPAGVPDSPTSPPAPTGTPSSVLVEVGTVATVTATAALYDQNLADENGCDPSGCGAGLTRVSHNRRYGMYLRHAGMGASFWPQQRRASYLGDHSRAEISL